MEGPIENVESFKSFKERITAIYENEGLSKKLYREVEIRNKRSQEEFGSFKKEIAQIFEKEGLSESLSLKIDVWHEERQEETKVPGGTIKQRVKFQIELAEVYIVVGKNDSAYETLNDAWTEANHKGLVDLKLEIEGIIKSLPG